MGNSKKVQLRDATTGSQQPNLLPKTVISQVVRSTSTGDPSESPEDNLDAILLSIGASLDESRIGQIEHGISNNSEQIATLGSSIETLNIRIGELESSSAGKTKTYVISTDEGSAPEYANAQFKSSEDSISVDSNSLLKLTAGGSIVSVMVSNLACGDVILVKDTNYPDRWAFPSSSGGGQCIFYRMESLPKLDPKIIFDSAYPVGSIFITTIPVTNWPQISYGRWTQICSATYDEESGEIVGNYQYRREPDE